ncbi:DUF3566 domain-containing protein [Herbiconiux sp. SYSU D00978]|uniref:DUF3566 domain-containing protein n=1 Tax=Herbiconiux sp. SYSU D00978 TaxID=2812562 RepID=UPI001A96AEF3|nr:DUF3566 domain-containing protein [Herbiconiux sp. SYSU D00978]
MSSVAEKLQRKAPKPVSGKQVRLKLVYIDFWSAVKLAFLISVAGGVVLIVATFLIWNILALTGVFGSISDLLRDILGQENFNVTDVVSLPQVLLFSIIVAALNVVVGTALGAVIAMLYNFSVRITGGLLVGFTNN